MIAGIIVLLAANIVYLDIVVLDAIVSKKNEVPIAVTASETCSGACVQTLSDMVNARLATSVAVPTRNNSTQPALVTTPKEYYIPLGSGMTKSDIWETVPGVEATIDTSQYPKIKQVIFETYLRIPVGIGWMHVKLYNATDGHDVWGSEVKTESNISTYKNAVVSLDPGNKRYTVKAMSTIRADSYLDNIRIKIITY